MELVWMNYVWFDVIGIGYIGNRNGATRLLRWNWLFIAFGSDLRILHRVENCG